MNRRENHWYTLGTMVVALVKSLRPRAWQLALWLLGIVLFVIGFRTGVFQALVDGERSTMLIAGAAVLLVVLAFVANVMLQRSRAQAGYLRALQHPGPEQVVALIERSMRSARLLADADAFSAQARAIAFALYGRGEDATRVLGEVHWATKAPLIQAVGLSAEGLVALLCRRDVPRALELTRRARALATVSPALPGSAQTERYHATCVAAGEALLNAGTAASVKTLEASAADRRFTPLDLLASFGLAAALEHAGNHERAARLRGFLREAAPHCGPLHLKPADFAAGGLERAASVEGPVSFQVAQAPVAGTGPGMQERSARKRLIVVAGVVVGAWVLLLALFAVLWAFFDSHR